MPGLRWFPIAQARARGRQLPAERWGTARVGWLGASVLVLLVACDSPTEPDPRPGWVLRPSILLHHGVPAFLFTPESVRRDSTFAIAFTTFGPGCDEQGGTEVLVTGLMIEVTPMDWTRASPRAGECPENVVRVFPRAVSVRFVQPGEGRVRIVGRREPGGAMVTFSARVTVR